MGRALKSTKIRNWDDVTLKSLVEAVASEHNLKSAIVYDRIA